MHKVTQKPLKKQKISDMMKSKLKKDNEIKQILNCRRKTI